MRTGRGRRLAAGVWLAVALLAAAVLGAADAALRTAAGRAVVVRYALQAANDALHGTLRVEQIQGSVRDGLEARGVVVQSEDGLVLAEIPRLAVRYRLRDLLSGRVVLGQLRMERPRVTLVRLPNGRLNLEEVLGLGGPNDGRPGPLIAFRDVEIEAGAIEIRTPLGPGESAPEWERGPYGAMRVRRVDGLVARLPYARLSSPFRGERGIRIEIDDLRARLSEPGLHLRGAQGSAELVGDTLHLDLAQAVLPGSRARLRGTLSWPHDTLEIDLEAETVGGALDDIRGFAPTLPRGLLATGEFMVRSRPGGALEVRAPEATIVGRNRGGRFSGRLGIVLGPGETWAAVGTDVTLTDFDLEYVRPILDTLPLAGRLSGRLTADGPRDRLMVSLDWTFRDSLVPGWPVSRARAEGVVRIGVPGEFVFRAFRLERASLDLGTVRRILPAVALRGRLDGAGTLNGPWLEPEYSGTLQHRDDAGIESVARGVVRVDARRDTIGVWTNLAVDSLRFEGFHSSYPGFTLRGAWAGDLRLSGFADSLRLDGEIQGPAGRLVGGGTLTLVPPHYAVRGLELEALDLSLVGLHPLLPETRLFGRATGEIALDTLVAPRAQLAVSARRSLIGGSRLDSLRAELSVADSGLAVSSLGAWAPAVGIVARGGLGLTPSRRDSLGIQVRADSVRGLEPLVRGLFDLEADTLAGGPAGGVTLTLGVGGWIGDYRVTGQARAPLLDWGALRAVETRLRGQWRSTERGEVRLEADADSLSWGGYTLARPDFDLAGRRDSLGWSLATGLGSFGRLAAAGRLHADSLAVALPLDSVRIQLPVLLWRADTGAVIVVTDSSVQVRRLRLASADGGSQLILSGDAPTGGSGHLQASLQRLPLQDLFALLQREDFEASGDLSGTGTLSGTARGPVMQATLASPNAVFGDFHSPHVEGTLHYESQRLVGRFAWRRLGERVVDLDLDVPVDLALAGADERFLPGPLSVRAVADSVDLAFTEALTPLVRRAGGRLDADVRIAGTWDRPQLTGSVSVRDGAATLPGIGVRHEALNGRLLLTGDTVRIETLSVKSGPGTLRLSGYVRLERLSRPVLRLRLAAQDFTLMDVRNFLSLSTSGDVSLTGPVFGAALTGEGTVTRGVVYFADLVKKQVVNLEDTLYQGLVDTSLIRQQGLGRAFENRFWDLLTIDSLRLAMGNDVWLRSAEANIQLTGDVSLSKVADRYRLDGVLQTPRGTYRLPVAGQAITREFTVTRGEVQYFGTPDLNAALDIDAQHVVRRRREDNVTVSVHIGGTLYVPRLTLASDIRPAISDAQIISYLLFGTDTPESFAGSEARNRRQLIQAGLGGLAGALSGQLENTLISSLGIPLDYLLITPDVTSGLTGAEIAAGWQFSVLGAPTFLTVSPRLCGALSQTNFGASLEFRLTREWRVAASVDPVRTCGTGPEASTTRLQAGVDLFWEKRF